MNWERLGWREVISGGGVLRGRLSGVGDNSKPAGWPGHRTEGRMRMGREGLQGKLWSPDGWQPGNRNLSLPFLLVINSKIEKLISLEGILNSSEAGADFLPAPIPLPSLPSPPVPSVQPKSCH